MKLSTDVELLSISKKFGGVVAVEDFSLNINEGEFVSILGPSGCGKTTTLRIIAGLTKPDEGRVYIKGKDVTHVPVHKRKISLVFQNYALWPHMNVYKNIAFGLRLQKVNKGEIDRRVKEVLEIVDLKGVEQRFCRELSGGQQQRVALARALVMKNPVLLLDEPLSNLDRKLREETKVELKRIQRELHLTTIYVTHDQEEALEMSDRIVVMNKARSEQIGTPIEIYTKPATRFVANFIGTMNFLNSKVSEIIDESRFIAMTDAGLVLNVSTDHNLRAGESVLLSFRPERAKIQKQALNDHKNVFPALIANISYAGRIAKYSLVLADKQVLKLDEETSGELKYKEGERVFVEIPERAFYIFR